ncbi:MAG: 50S ribosomal protein L11 methyltransferase [Deltaproteobacteria bacterium]|nr:50S ribosomal protein L11 methyltransferase [Deltaproteobacteria bacterium]
MIASEIPAAAAGTQLRGDEVVFWVERADSAGVLIATCEAVARWQANGANVSPQRVRLSEAVPETEWRDAWKKFFKVSKLTRQFVVVPSWERYVAHDSEVVIDLDPGMAFGTGTHASTRLVLEELQELADLGVTPARILDVGCGSGILSIAATKRWPESTCLAIDNDQLAVDATLDNASVNRVADRIDSGLTPVGELTEQFPLVLANIQAHVLRELKSALIARLVPGGTLILSGLLTPQAQPLADEFVAAGLRLIRVRESADDPQWSSATLRR